MTTCLSEYGLKALRACKQTCCPTVPDHSKVQESPWNIHHQLVHTLSKLKAWLFYSLRMSDLLLRSTSLIDEIKQVLLSLF